MKKLNSLKLDSFSKAEMEKRKMNSLKGGGVCICVGNFCGCLYQGEQCPSGDSYWGGSNTFENADANNDPITDSVSKG